MFENKIALELNINENQVKSVLKLISDGATIPFVSRYRKDHTGGLDEVSISKIIDLNTQFDQFYKRQNNILSKLNKLSLIPNDTIYKITNCSNINELEDLYLPFKQKKTTRASKAKEKGLLGLAKIIMAQKSFDIEQNAKEFAEKSNLSIEEAINGASDIIAEWISENEIVRSKLRYYYNKKATINSTVIEPKKKEALDYQDYFNRNNYLNKIPSYAMLAMLRGEKEKLLKIKIDIEKNLVFDFLERFYIKNNNKSAEIIRKAYEESYKRLIQPSLESEFKKLYKIKAEDKSIDVFTKNLKNLLMEAPLGQKRVLAIDPGFKSGCKIVCLKETGELLHNENIYPHPPQNNLTKAKNKLFQLIQTYKIEAIAIGDGTAFRETEKMIKSMRFNDDIMVFSVREDGASIYSASSIAREEFPTFDVTVRGAVSIGRRLQDPLSELVKINPQSIGVGQYQHDINQKKLNKSLERVIVSVVNEVGVEVNNASKYVLQYISGLGPKLAQNIINYRKENGSFKSRNELKKVPLMGTKAFEQSAGFLRVKNASNPLDNCTIHPESYLIVKKISRSIEANIENLIGNEELINKLDYNNFQNIGKHTWQQLISELRKPKRDPRKKVKLFEFSKVIQTIHDLKEGMILPGIINNVTDFGAFVNIGIKQNGLLHKSEINNNFVNNPSNVLSLNQQLKVKIISVDLERKRIGLSTKNLYS